MQEVFIKYDTTFEEWSNEFKKGLEEHGVVYNDTMLSAICNSLNNTITKYLTAIGYRPRGTQSYRKGFINKLKQNGLAFNIKTNYVFWKYLEYFTDLTEYSRGFDLSIDIENIELATKDMIFVSVNGVDTQGVVNHPLHCEEYTDILNKLEFVKGLVDKNADVRIIKDMLNHITDIVDYLIRRVD